MSDERDAAPHVGADLYIHYCEHSGCTKWGGFAVGKAAPNWFCFEHRPEWKARHA
ncbi:hypothetical protein SAMCCGM7_pC0359 (plasmid) [Sinorhizobium americanum CCGM7]|uniref:hypothetical protein n=1 Tax=Sinorhizobium americanum TaxID=194963 RepID=UPI0004DB1EB7|nr:hypothetical protein [Sinorhizobium americanum]APG87561.1 hypothetical protein SAMCCGM7_pC0359 [Sinorhizobium americanum CCGM7]